MTKTPNSRIGKLIRKRALSYPETTEEFPWGEHAFKVNRKTFVFMRADADETSFSVKLPHSRKAALSLPGSEPTHYGMGAKGWVTLRPDEKSSMDALFGFIDESYRAVAPKRALARLPQP
jgi:predicted DNA-binding protein (MmcQ/YjbR family)